MRIYPICHKRILNNGIDLSVRYENVYSVLPDTVVKDGQDNRYGKFFTVRAGDYTISYCHQSQPFFQENCFLTVGGYITFLEIQELQLSRTCILRQER